MNTTPARPGTRIRLAALLAAVALAAVACGGTKAKTASTPTTQAPSTTSPPASTAAPASTSSTTAQATTTTSQATTTTSAPSVPACATDGLRVAAGGPTDPGAGSVTYPLTFTNTGGAPCTLSGYPGVSAVNSAGQQLGQPAARTGQASSVVVVQPGQSATAGVRVAQAGNFDPASCGTPTQAAGFRVYPPGQTASVVVPASVNVCTGSVVQMQINPLAS